MNNEERTYRLEQIKEAFYETDEYEEVYNEESTDLIIVECQEGHRYKIDYSKESYKKDIVRGCPYCKGYGIKIKNKCSYNNNLLSLKTFVDRMALNEEFDNYTFYDKEGKEKDISELTICSSEPITIKLKNEDCEDVLKIINSTFEYEGMKFQDVGCWFIYGIRPEFIVYKTGIGEHIKYRQYHKYDVLKCCHVDDYSLINNYYTYYYLDSELDEYDNHYILTKEILDIYKILECNDDVLYNMHTFVKKHVPLLNEILNEPDFKKRMQLLGKKPQLIKIYKFKKGYTCVKRKLFKNNEECLEIISKINEINKQLETLNNTKSKLLRDLKNNATDINQFNHYMSQVEMDDSLYNWCIRPENKEIGQIVIERYLPRKNRYTLNEVSCNSPETIYIKGSRGTTFKTTPKTITEKGKILPKLPSGTSYSELFIYYYFKAIFPNTIHRGKAPEVKYEYDITIPEKKLVIEYNGSIYHKIKYDKTEDDNNKMEYARNCGVNYIRIEDDGESYEPKLKGWLISYKFNYDDRDNQLYKICRLIKNKVLHNMALKEPSIKDIKKQIDLYY